MLSPPNGSSEYAPLYIIEGDAGGASHETCIDWYGTNKGYSGADCMYYSGEEAKEFPGGEYGYPRVERRDRDPLRGRDRVRQQMRSPDMKRPSRPLAIVSILAAVGIVIAVAAAVASNDSGSSKPSPVVRRAVSQRLYRMIGVLRHAHGASTSTHPLPSAVAEGTSQEVGIQPSQAVYAGGTYPTWVIPGSTEVCLVHGASSATSVAGAICGTVSAMEQRGLAETTESASGSPVVLGLVPNGNTSIEVTDENGSKETVPVVNNVYEITSGDPVSAKLKNAAGAITTRHLPSLSIAAPSAPPAG